VEDRVSLEKELEGVEAAMVIGLVTQMSHRFPHSTMDMTCITVQAYHVAAITSEEGMV